ncbi:hypothetical protein SMF913_11557 [Streptomyces malaysiensis]|uniref:Uncharacterized protein n=1 Tax=Streptomyces malaysiensis TaxID=92644 RepID=A0A2J7Z5I1_STRMQ|nr:hypothetical protein SMF913_11557 [Streptomyces malaysiensis]
MIAKRALAMLRGACETVRVHYELRGEVDRGWHRSSE